MKHLRAHPSMWFVCTKNLSLWLHAGNDCELKTIVTCFEFVFWSSSHCMIYLVSSWNARSSEFIVCCKGYPLKSWASEILTWMWSIGTSFQARNEANGCMCSMTPHMKGLLCSWPHTWKASYAHDCTHERPPILMTAHMKGLLRVDNYASAEHHERASTQMNPEVALQVAGERW